MSIVAASSGVSGVFKATAKISKETITKEPSKTTALMSGLSVIFGIDEIKTHYNKKQYGRLAIDIAGTAAMFIPFLGPEIAAIRAVKIAGRVATGTWVAAGVNDAFPTAEAEEQKLIKKEPNTSQQTTAQKNNIDKTKVNQQEANSKKVDMETYQVQQGDNLSKISRKIGDEKTTKATMVAIYQLNKNSFINGDPNLLKENTILKIPTSDFINEISKDKNLIDNFAKDTTLAWKNKSKFANVSEAAANNTIPTEQSITDTNKPQSTKKLIK